MPILNCSGVTVFYREAGNFILEALCLHGPNVASFQLATERQRWNVIGYYIAPGNAYTIEDVVVAIRRRPQGGELLADGDLGSTIRRYVY